MSHKRFIENILNEDLGKILSQTNLGFEKESLRIKDTNISKSVHPRKLGSALCNRFITIDFSEAQLELITPPIKGNTKPISMLDDIHHFVSQNIEEELLWPLSMPPKIASEDDIPVGNFGSSNEGMFKHIYRLGLANRYGKGMQAISGFHFNYSLPDHIWSLLGNVDEIEMQTTRSKIYFNVLKNIHRMNWLLIYLFGASPVIHKELVKDKGKDFLKLDDEYFYLPYSTSLRMSEYGYSNIDRKKILISINTLNEYVSDLRLATETLDEGYETFEKNKNAQLNANILQIEAEYYAIARAKASHHKGSRMTSNLIDRGVEFIEIRSLDLNPFSRLGIDREVVLFFEIFMMLCLFNESDDVDHSTMQDINLNDIKVAKFGRKTDTLLTKGDSKLSIKDWGNQILAEMEKIISETDYCRDDYEQMIVIMRSRINNPEKTLSSRILESLKSKKISYTEFGNNIAHENKQYFMQRDQSTNQSWEIFKNEARVSLEKQELMEIDSKKANQTFEQYKKDHFDY